MADPPRELLLILESALANQALRQLEPVVIITQALRPRLVLIQDIPGVQKRLIGIAGVAGIYHCLSADLPADLSFAERVFISAWEARQHPKSRPGEGLSWDAPGFVAPDAPIESQYESSDDDSTTR